MKPLENSNIFITKSKEEITANFLSLENYCNKIFYMPTIKIKSLISDEIYNELKNKFEKFDYIIFTSKNSVEVFADFLTQEKKITTNKIIVAIGDATSKKCAELNLSIDIIPDNFSAEGLITYFSKINVKGKYFLIPTSKLATNELKNALEKFGAVVDSINIYDVVPNYEIKNIISETELNTIDIYAFTSPSSFKYFLTVFEIDDIDKFFNKKIICAIGKTTEKAINNYELNVNVVPQNYSLDFLAEAIIKFYKLQKNIV
ncbi:MAG: uroporphyrinogen-III synthase [Stygiobacter sp.]